MLADTDVGNIVTAAQSGTQWGYRLLPVPLLLIVPLLPGLLAVALFAQGHLALLVMGIVGAGVFSAPGVVQRWRSLRRRAGLMGGAGVLVAAAIGAVAEPSVAHGIGGTVPALSIVLPLAAAGVVGWLGFRRRGLREAAR